MKKLLSLILVLALLIALPAMAEGKTIVIGASPSPHAEILEFIKDDMEALGYTLDIKIFTEYPLPNPALDAGELDANYFQHLLYLQDYNATIPEERHLNAAIGVHYEPFAIYAGITKSLEDLQDGAVITVPNDPSNETRALLLLQEAGLISLPEGASPSDSLTVMDVINPRNFDIREIDANQLPSTLEDVDIAVINGNFALDAGLTAVEDGLFLEPVDGEDTKSYINYLVVRPDALEQQWFTDLRSMICSDKVQQFILEKEDYKGGVVPAFTVE